MVGRGLCIFLAGASGSDVVVSPVVQLSSEWVDRTLELRDGRMMVGLRGAGERETGEVLSRKSFTMFSCSYRSVGAWERGGMGGTN